MSALSQTKLESWTYDLIKKTSVYGKTAIGEINDSLQIIEEIKAFEIKAKYYFNFQILLEPSFSCIEDKKKTVRIIHDR